MSAISTTQGSPWDVGAISTGEFRGVPLRDILSKYGITSENKQNVSHVHFYAVDSPFVCSIPVEKALNSEGDVLLATHMNGEPLNREHGFPLRLITPGYAGVRNVKWVERIEVSKEESQGAWQRGMAYKYFAPWVKDLKGIAISEQPTVYEMPVQSCVCDVNTGRGVFASDTEVEVRGFAWSGGGRGIVNVGVSVDGGKTWQSAELGEGKDQPIGRAWAWTFWSCTIPLTEEAKKSGEIEVVCRAVDSSFNSQPERKDLCWNVRGILNNSWHHVTLPIQHD
jgi:sulfite oxidase